MNKITVIITLLLILSLCACGGANNSVQQNITFPEVTENTSSSVDEAADKTGSENGLEYGNSAIGIPNPIRAATTSEVLEKTGISFIVPLGAKDVAYYILDLNGWLIAEMTFTFNGANSSCRICSTEGPTDSPEDVLGMYYEWTREDTAMLRGNDAELHWIEGEQGIALWYDYVPGLLYSLSVDSGASRDSLLSLAEELYIPVQGDADVESAEEPIVSNGNNEVTSTADSIVALAVALIGAEYEWGAAGPDTFDNSGFVYYCFKENGITLSRKTGDMFAAGTVVELEDLLPGDLVFFTYNEDRSASYVGIYIGEGQFIAENNESRPVSIHDMTLDYYSKIFVGARRYL